MAVELAPLTAEATPRREEKGGQWPRPPGYCIGLLVRSRCIGLLVGSHRIGSLVRREQSR